ncbi:MAG: methyltransferase domain-containing protein [Bacteroidetes bacterium]|nr:methyltransferase domain-containing protein [Bacteroidota bacterium]
MHGRSNGHSASPHKNHEQRFDKTNFNITAMVGDACDLKHYPSEEFDVVLNMGAVYHIEKQNISGCLRENIRVLKPGGYLVIAYINKYAGYENDKFATFFNFHSPAEIEEYVMALNMRIIEHVPTDGDIYVAIENKSSNSSSNQQGFKEKQFWLEENLPQYHSWLDENIAERDIHTIREKFVHALLIARKP